MRSSVSLDFTVDRKTTVEALFEELGDEIVSISIADSQAGLNLRLVRADYERIVTAVDARRKEYARLKGLSQQSRFVADIRRARADGRLRDRFLPSDLREACPGWADATYSAFPPQYRRGNPSGHVPYFEQNEDGTYSLLDEPTLHAERSSAESR